MVTALSAIACGHSSEADDPEPAPSLTPVPYAGEALLRRGTEVDGFCAARRGSLTAFGAIERGELRVYTSNSPGLEEASFSAGPLLGARNGLTDCSLVATASGFAIAWLSSTDDRDGVSVLRLSSDGVPLGEPLTIPGHDRGRITLAAEGERIYLGRIIDEDEIEKTSIWIDTLEGNDLSSEVLDTCAVPSLPVILPTSGVPSVFHTCQRDGSTELVLSSIRNGLPARDVVALGGASFPNTPLAVVEDSNRWVAAWVTDLGASPQLLTIEKETLEVDARPLEPTRGEGATHIASVDVGASSTGLLTTLRSCSETDGSVECWTDLCSLPSVSGPGRCTSLEVPDVSELLVQEGFATLAYLELADDGGGDLFTLPIDASGAAGPLASPVLGPGWLEPRRVSCFEGACSVFGREGGSRAHGAERASYGFWSLSSTSDPTLPAVETPAFGALDPVVDSGFWDWDWSVASAFRTGTGARLGIFVSSGVVAEHELGELGQALGLYREDYAGMSRYRLFEQFPSAAGGEVSERVLDADLSDRRPVGARPLEAIASCGDGYIATDGERRLHRYRPDTEQAFIEGGRLPDRDSGSGELIRCLGQRAIGLVYGSAGMLLYRERADGTFRQWRYGDAEAGTGAFPPPPNAPFGAVAGQLADGRLVFVVHPPGSFEVSLAALAIGESDEPQLFELERPEPWVISAASVPEVAPPGFVVLAWTDLASRSTWLSRWSLPAP